jgi:hypothetical protein
MEKKEIEKVEVCTNSFMNLKLYFSDGTEELVHLDGDPDKLTKKDLKIIAEFIYKLTQKGQGDE